jgi:hypothetical protein
VKLIEVNWWRVDHRPDGGWTWFSPHIRIGRLRANFRIHKHVYAPVPDRIAVQTDVYYDRKRKSTWKRGRHGQP